MKFLILILALFSCSQAEYSSLHEGSNRKLGNQELPGFATLHSSKLDGNCFGAILNSNTLLAPLHCIDLEQKVIGGLSFTVQNGRPISPIAIYHSRFKTFDAQGEKAWITKAKMDLAIVVFPKDTFSFLIAKNSQLPTLAKKPTPTGQDGFLLYLDAEGNRRLTSVKISLRFDGVIYTADASIEKEGLVHGFLLDANSYEIIGIASSMKKVNLELLLLADNRTSWKEERDHKDIENVVALYNPQGPEAYEVYDEAINCQSAAYCAQDFPNSGISAGVFVAKETAYSNRDGLRCQVDLKMQKNSRQVQSMQLTGVGPGCSRYSATFDVCHKRSCRSTQTCESISFDPSGFILKTGGQEFNFGETELLNIKQADSAVKKVSLSQTKKCIKSELKLGEKVLPQKVNCSASGVKIVSVLNSSYTHDEAKEICENPETGYSFASIATLEDFSNSKIWNHLDSQWWTNERLGANEETQSIDPERKTFGKKVQNNAIDERHSVVCVCGLN